MPAIPDEARARRKSGDLARNRSTKDQKERTDLAPGGGGGGDSAGPTGTGKFPRNIEISTIERANQVQHGQDRVKGRLRAQNWRD